MSLSARAIALDGVYVAIDPRVLALLGLADIDTHPAPQPMVWTLPVHPAIAHLQIRVAHNTISAATHRAPMPRATASTAAKPAPPRTRRYVFSVVPMPTPTGRRP